MPLNLKQKTVIVEQVAARANAAIALVAVDYCGLTSPQMTLLRQKARQANVHLQIVRNTLARRAFKDTHFECVSEKLVGPVLLAFSTEEPSSPARLMQDFAKEHDALEIKALSLGDTVFGKEKLSFVAQLSTRTEALSRLLGTLQAPITQFVRTLAEPQAKLVRVLAAIRDKKTEQGE